MLPDATLPVPASLMTLLAGLAPSFTAPSFRTFCGLACGFVAQAWHARQAPPRPHRRPISGISP
jgi:hypothetical protein